MALSTVPTVEPAEIPVHADASRFVVLVGADTFCHHGFFDHLGLFLFVYLVIAFHDNTIKAGIHVETETFKLLD